MDIEYLDGVIATVAEHKKNMIEAIRSYMNDNEENILENTHTLEEVARFLNELVEEWQDIIYANVVYSEGLNHFEIKKATYKEIYDNWTTKMAFSARQYFGLLRLASGNFGTSSYDLQQALSEGDYERALVEMGVIERGNDNE